MIAGKPGAGTFIELDRGDGGPPARMRYADALQLVQQRYAAGEYGRAQLLVDQLAEKFPDDIVPRALTLEILIAQRRPADAARLAEEISGAAAINDVWIVLCIRALRQGGRADRASQLAERAVQEFPDSALVRNELGMLLTGTGRKDEALTAFRDAIRLDPFFIPPYWGRARLTARALGEDELAGMLRVAESVDLGDEDRAILEFAIAWAYESTDSDRHFERLHVANRSVARRRPWNAAAEAARVVALQKFFAPDFVEGSADAGIRGFAPIFVAGLPRSGTTLVEQILASHPDVTGLGETAASEHALTSIARRHGLKRLVWQWASAPEFPAFFPEFDTAWRELSQAASATTRRVTEKSLTLDLWAGLLMTMYPEARLLHCRRHPLDTCLSMYQHHFFDGPAYIYDLAHIVARFRQHVDLMSHWSRLFPGRVSVVNYESLVDNPRETIAALLNSLGLDWHDDCLSFHRNRSTARSASRYQVTQPIYRSSVGRWKRHAKHLRDVAERLGVDISAEL